MRGRPLSLLWASRENKIISMYILSSKNEWNSIKFGKNNALINNATIYVIKWSVMPFQYIRYKVRSS